MVDPETARFLEFNETAHRLLGYSREEFSALCVHDVEAAETPEEIHARMAKGTREGPIDFETRLRTRQGATKDVHATIQVAEMQGRPVIHGVWRDITARKKTEAALRESQALYGALVEQMPAGIFRKDAAGRYVYVNAWFCRFWGFAPEFFLGRTADEFGAAIAHRGPERFDAANDVALASGGAGHHETIMRTGQTIEVDEERVEQNGLRRSVHAVKTPVFDAEGKIIGSQGILLDITSRREAELSLRKLLRAIEQSPVSIVITDAAGRIEYANPKFTEVSGYTLDEVQGDNPRVLKSGETKAEVYRELWQTIAAGQEWRGELHNRKKSGALFWEHVLISPVTDAAGRITHYVAVKEDITEQLAIDRALRESQERYQQVVETIAEAVWVSDLKTGNATYVSPAFEKIWGRPREEFKVSPGVWRDSLHAEDRPRVLQDLLPRQMRGDYDEIYRIRRPNGDVRWIHDKAYPVKDGRGEVIRLVGVAEDITAHHLLEEQLRRSQRMEAIGALASGIAHDLNNILSPMLLAPSLLRESLKGARERELLAMVEQGARRGTEIVRQLLTFSRGSGGERVPVQLRHLLTEMRGIAAETFPREITVRMDVAANLLPVLGDATQLHQVLLNLCVNARDAMPGGGTLTLRGHNTVVEAGLAGANPPAKPGPFALIAVADSGQGIPAEIVERIFDPFFTTKEVGKGTGLGLSTVLGIVRSHGGFVTVESVVDQGATFNVFLPVAPTAEPVVAAALAAQPPAGSGELILLVDDEKAVRDACRYVLERHGYRVVQAENGGIALSIFRLRAAEVALVVTDVMMPVMNGVKLIAELRAIQPGVKTMAMTGMASDDKHQELATLGVGDVVQKPCSPRELLEAVQRALARV